MINLAGIETCDQTIKEELSLSGIEIVNIGKMNREVPASIIGKCNNFIFKRAWYYWVVEGYLPLEQANYLFENFKHLNIRVNGNHEDTKPIEWCQPKNMDNVASGFFQDLMNKKITQEEFEEKCKEIKSQGEQFVKSYHIDTQDGLNAFVKVVKENNIIG
jgi:hypothetical protein